MTLPELAEFIEVHWRRTSNLSDTLQGVTPTDLFLALDAIDSTSDLAELVANRSYVHTNGYYKIVLRWPSKDTPLTLRMNVWEYGRGVLDSEPDLHNHRWDYASVVLRGTFANEVFRVAPGEAFRRFSYRPHAVPRSFAMEPAGQANLELTSTLSLAPGQRYEMPHHIVHRFVPSGSGIHATLMLQGPAIRSESDVFLPASHQPEMSVVPRIMHVEELARLCERLGSP